MRPMRTAAWRDVPPPGLSRAEQRWIVQADSLTQALSAVGRFRVICLQQNHGLATVDEWACLGLPRRQRVWQRDVLLLLNETPVIFAHTILPAHATTTDWPFFSHLGNRSLGSALFSDPLIARQPLQFAQLSPAHQLNQRAQQAMRSLPSLTSFTLSSTWARRSVFARGAQAAPMLVTEVFLPNLFQEFLVQPKGDHHAFTK